MQRFDAVLFDFADTLFDSRSALRPELMAARCADAGFTARPEDCARWIETIVAFVATPKGQAIMRACDFSLPLHRASWTACVHACEDIPPAFADPFYDVFCNAVLWRPFSDALSVLRALSAQGIAIGVVSNIGWNVRPALEVNHMTGFVDAVVQSFEVGAVKPNIEPFAAALEQLQAQADRTLMVGDNWATDGGAQAAGITTLLLPVVRDTRQPRGLDMVLDLVGIGRPRREFAEAAVGTFLAAAGN
jgi:FMN phosphatase YigB (HAD superfamily)